MNVDEEFERLKGEHERLRKDYQAWTGDELRPAENHNIGELREAIQRIKGAELKRANA